MIKINIIASSLSLKDACVRWGVRRISTLRWSGLGLVLAFFALVSLPLSAQGTGYWHTSGNQILDSTGTPVRIAGINWYGFETTSYVVNGLWAQDYKSILNTIKDNGYNVIRLPFSNQVVESPQIPGSINYGNGMNSDLAGLNSLQIMDKIVGYAGSIGLRVILDNHRSEAGNSAEQNGLWYTSAYPESAWLNDWSTMVNRYQGFTDASGNPTVIGVDLRNEPHNATSGGSCWGCGTLTNDWRLAAERAGNEVQGINPHLLIFVEGTDCFNGNCDWWGGNLQGAATYPVQLNIANQLVYSAHDYGPSISMQPWFNSSTTYTSLSDFWTSMWAYLSQNNVAPVWVGEFGTDNVSTDIENTTAGSEGQWFQSLVTFLQNSPKINWTYWALNGEDSDGLLDNNYDPTPVSALKQQLLASIQFSLNGGGGAGGGSTVPSAPTGLAASATSSSQINLTWTASSTTGVTYSVYGSTSSGFTPSSSNLLSGGLTTTSYSNTGLTASTEYYYVVEAVDASGASSPSNQANATTQANAVTVPTAPTGLTASATSSSQINLTWTASSTTGVTYTVFRSTASGFTPSSSNQLTSGVTSTTYSDTGLTASTAYYYVVEASDSAGNSPASNQASATTQAGGGGVTSGPVSIDAGGPAAGSYVADVDFSGGTVSSTTATINTSNVANAAPQAVYQTERYGPSTYTIPGLTAGSQYTVTLQFAEIYWTSVGQREFNVIINGTQVLTNFDIVAAAGGPDIAIAESFTATANSSGQIVVQFTNGAANYAKISGIEVQ